MDKNVKKRCKGHVSTSPRLVLLLKKQAGSEWGDSLGRVHSKWK